MRTDCSPFKFRLPFLTLSLFTAIIVSSSAAFAECGDYVRIGMPVTHKLIESSGWRTQLTTPIDSHKAPMPTHSVPCRGPSCRSGKPYAPVPSTQTTIDLPECACIESTSMKSLLCSGLASLSADVSPVWLPIPLDRPG